MSPLGALAVAGAGQRGLATGAQLTRAGLSRGRLARAVTSGELIRIHRNVYGRAPLRPSAPHLLTDAGADPAYLLAVQAALLGAGSGAVACGRTAAVIWGLDMLVEPDVVELQVPRGSSRLNLTGVVGFQRPGPVVQSATVSGLRVTPVPATLRFCARTRPLVEAVALVDSALRRQVATLGRLPVARGSALHRAVLLADPRSESVLESALRVLLVRAGLPAPRTQYVIRGAGRFLARVDFCWPELRLVVEADGRRWHDPADSRTADRRRSNACAAYGWRVLRFTWADVLHNPAYVIASVQQALLTAA